MTQIAGISRQKHAGSLLGAHQKKCRSCGEKWQIYGMPRLEKPTKEWVERRALKAPNLAAITTEGVLISPHAMQVWRECSEKDA
jgi:hypothetical protein